VAVEFDEGDGVAAGEGVAVVGPEAQPQL
jgi:hypothetical protein